MDFGEWKNQNDEADLEKRLLKIRNESKKKHKLDEINQSGCLENLLGKFILNNCPRPKMNSLSRICNHETLKWQFNEFGFVNHCESVDK